MKFLTLFGEEIFFLLVFAFIYWCFSKEFALKLGLVYCGSAIINGVLKKIVKRPRPYVQDSQIKDIKHASGTSFPSGHSQSYACIATTSLVGYHRYEKSTKKMKLILYIFFVSFAIIVPFTRMYLGQHFLTDTICGVAIGVVWVLLVELILKFLPKKIKEIPIQNLIAVLFIIACIGTIVSVMIGVSNKSVYKYLCLFLGFASGYLLEIKYVNYKPYSTDKKLQSVKCIIGFSILAIVLIPTNLFVKDLYANMILSKFVVPFVITFVCPLLFSYLSRRRNEHI